MKLAIISAAILASSSAFAFPQATDQGHVFFTGEKFASCSMNVLGNHAKIFFEDVGVNGVENFAEVELVSELASKAVLHVSSAWEIAEAWGGFAPNTVIHTSVEGGNIQNTTNQYKNEYEFTETLAMTSASDQRSLFKIGVQADPMTHKGAARIDALVQFECE